MGCGDMLVLGEMVCRYVIWCWASLSLCNKNANWACVSRGARENQRA